MVFLDVNDNEQSVRVPPLHGLMLYLHREDEGTVTVEAMGDAHYPEIHPNCYGPMNMSDVRLLHGGGSGTAVFHGLHPVLGSMVMKHGSAKDANEVLALASIRRQLMKRGDNLNREAAESMRQRIPEFIMLYMSPYHLRDRTSELWATLRSSVRGGTLYGRLCRTNSDEQLKGLGGSPKTNPPKPGSMNTIRPKWRPPTFGLPMPFKHKVKPLSQPRKIRMQSVFVRNTVPTSLISPESSSTLTPGSPDNNDGKSGSVEADVDYSESSFFSESSTGSSNSSRARRDIIVTNQYDDGVSVDVNFRNVLINIPHLEGHIIPDGIGFLEDLLDPLTTCMSEQNWKITLAQKTIGGLQPQNGASDVLLRGKLKGPLLCQLIDDFIAVMRDLRELTYPDERSNFQKVKDEVQLLRETKDVRNVSKEADAFVGFAIRKNFHPKEGRFTKMRQYGALFRSNGVVLTPEEELPGKMLGIVLQPGGSLKDVFARIPAPQYALDGLEESWLLLLEHAVSLQTPSATQRIWTCGLTDAGLHNSFLAEDRGLELFDLGQPGLMPQPAFLTKFLMSFFHTLGMDDDGTGNWVRRFYVVNDKLEITKETEEMIPYIDHVFNTTLDRLIEEVFDKEESVRELLVKYVVLQLVSDGAFCLNRWEEKGGGSERVNGHFRRLEMWLWRCLWDLYISGHVYQDFLIRNRRFHELH